MRRALACVLLASLGCASTPSRATSAPTTTATAPTRALPAWLLPADACPADVMAAVAVPSGPFDGVCDADLDACLRRCEGGQATACYAAALVAQQREPDPALSEALFLRGCRLGNVSSCTNRAAGLLSFEPEREGVQACAARTFALTCERQDPWGCTMYGRALAAGDGVPQDVQRALEVLPGGCRHGEDDPACQAARQLMHELQDDR